MRWNLGFVGSSITCVEYLDLLVFNVILRSFCTCGFSKKTIFKTVTPSTAMILFQPNILKMFPARVHTMVKIFEIQKEKKNDWRITLWLMGENVKIGNILEMANCTGKYTQIYPNLRLGRTRRTDHLVHLSLNSKRMTVERNRWKIGPQWH